jgi:hypothetical protein
MLNKLRNFCIRKLSGFRQCFLILTEKEVKKKRLSWSFREAYVARDHNNAMHWADYKVGHELHNDDNLLDLPCSPRLPISRSVMKYTCVFKPKILAAIDRAKTMQLVHATNCDNLIFLRSTDFCCFRAMTAHNTRFETEKFLLHY